MRASRWATRMALATAALSFLVGACGDDDDDAGATTTTQADDGETTTTGGDEEDGEFAELCAVAEEIDDVEDFPTADQIERYRALAPEEIADAVEVAGDPIVEHEGDVVALLAVFAEDDVEAATEEIDAFEEENCGLDPDERDLPEGVTEELEDDAARVDVVAVDYGFEIPEGITAGRTSFVLTNGGQEAHFMIIAKIAEGHTLDEALAFEGDPEEAGIIEPGGGESKLAAPGGDDEEILTMDLEPGDYGMVCFLPGPDGTPHAFMGMAVPFTVS